MQPYALTVDKFLDHAAKWSGDREIVTAERGRVTGRVGYAVLRERSNQMSGALAALGMTLGDRVATLAWNTQEHLELYYAAMGSGLVCHTLNPRLTAAHLAAMINEAEDRTLAASSDLAELARELLLLCPTLEHLIWIGGRPDDTNNTVPGSAREWHYESLLHAHGTAAEWGAFEEETPAGLCYTSGTTGKPKGVLYTHRSNYLHTLRSLQADAMAPTANDTILVAVPMFHANAWGLPFVAPAVGAKLVLPGRHMDGASLAMLMAAEGVTIATGVQTVWLAVLDHLDTVGGELPELKRVLIGGASCQEALIRRIERRLRVQVQSTWGMTELSPLGTVALPGAHWSRTLGSGRPVMGLDLKLTDAAGATLADQRGVVGHLWVKGPCVVDRYFNADTDALDAEGYFDTGDLASIDEAGNVTICGRSKDLIKSGGEWINPTEIEEIISRHPAVGLAAVMGRFDPKWGERPVLIVEPHKGRSPDAKELLDCLRGKVADWWIPDQVVLVESMPLAATGKIDKNRLRTAYVDGKIADEGGIR